MVPYYCILKCTVKKGGKCHGYRSHLWYRGQKLRTALSLVRVEREPERRSRQAFESLRKNNLFTNESELRDKKTALCVHWPSHTCDV